MCDILKIWHPIVSCQPIYDLILKQIEAVLQYGKPADEKQAIEQQSEEKLHIIIGWSQAQTVCQDNADQHGKIYNAGICG
jgi:hypothetical protein